MYNKRGGMTKGGNPLTLLQKYYNSYKKFFEYTRYNIKKSFQNNNMCININHRFNNS